MDKIYQRYRYPHILLRQLVKTDFKLRYQGSFLGYLWSLLRPLLYFAILYIVFVKFLGFGEDMPHIAVYLFLGLILWNFFTEVTSGSVGAIVGRGDLLRKINFPKYVIILAVSVSALVNIGLNLVILGLFMVADHVDLTWRALVFIPLIGELFILALGLGFLLSALFVRYRDVSYIWEVMLQMAFYATPILYLLQRIPEKYAKYVILNPMAQIIQDARYIIVPTKTQTVGTLHHGNSIFWLIPIGLTVAIAAAAAIYFRHQSKFFAEEI